MKKFIALLLCAALIFSLATVSFAAPKPSPEKMIADGLVAATTAGVIGAVAAASAVPVAMALVQQGRHLAGNAMRFAAFAGGLVRTAVAAKVASDVVKTAIAANIARNVARAAAAATMVRNAVRGAAAVATMASNAVRAAVMTATVVRNTVRAAAMTANMVRNAVRGAAVAATVVRNAVRAAAVTAALARNAVRVAMTAKMVHNMLTPVRMLVRVAALRNAARVTAAVIARNTARAIAAKVVVHKVARAAVTTAVVAGTAHRIHACMQAKCCTVEDPVTSADTFDAGVVIYAGLALMSVTGGALVVNKRKEF